MTLSIGQRVTWSSVPSADNSKPRRGTVKELGSRTAGLVKTDHLVLVEWDNGEWRWTDGVLLATVEDA